MLCFVHHCQFGYLNNTLKTYFHSLGVPYDDSTLSGSIVSKSQLMFNFFDILRRKVCKVQLHFLH